jgi:hypothetical protein
VTRPKVTIHNTTSIDGQLSGFPIDRGLHREVAGWFDADAMLVGCRGPRAYAREHGVDLDAAEVEPPVQVADDRSLPWLVLLDAGGRLKRLSWLRLRPELLREDLVDEVSIVLAPYLVESGLGALSAFAGAPLGGNRRLRLTSIKELRDDHAWLRYAT